MKAIYSCLMLVMFFLTGAFVDAQDLTSDIIVPQRRVISVRPVGDRMREVAPVVERVDASIRIDHAKAETSLVMTVRNTGSRDAEAQIILPVPEGAVFKAFSYGEHAGQYPARLMTATEARQLYDRIVSRLKDPALLEFAGYGAVRTSVFPVPAGKSMQVRIVYEQVLQPKGGRFDYVLLRSEAFDQSAEWNIRVEMASRDGKGHVSNIYSPTHEIDVRGLANNGNAVDLKKQNGKINPGPFKLGWQYSEERQGNGILSSASVYSCPSADQEDSGYFMIMASFPTVKERNDSDRAVIPREVTMVLDRSGSMRGENLDKVKESVRQIVAGLRQGELFNIITYNQGIDYFSEQPVVKSPESEKEAFQWIDSINARGGTNIYDALEAALSQPVRDNTLPIILFLTDGHPTIGKTAAVDIHNLVATKNQGKRRVFSIGVGKDLNAPLVRKISDLSGGTCTFILPKEDVEVKISDLFEQLNGPVAENVSLSVEPGMGRIRDVLPGRLPDCYAGAPLVILGQYVGNEPIRFVLKGNNLLSPEADQAGRNRIQELGVVEFDPRHVSSIKDDFVPRLWAVRQISALQASLRDMGIESKDITGLAADPKTKEIAEEIMKLSVQFGVMSDFTSFFADDGKNKHAQRDVRELAANFYSGAVSDAGFVAEANMERMRSSTTLNKTNRMLAVPQSSAMSKQAELTVRENTELYQIGQGSYVFNGREWTQGSLSGNVGNTDKARLIVIGTPEYGKVVDQLIKENRQGVLAIDGTVRIAVNGEEILLQNNIN